LCLDLVVPVGFGSRSEPGLIKRSGRARSSVASDASTGERDAAARPLHIAYLAGTFPSVSHTFISREINGLRDLGVELDTFSVRRPAAEELLNDADRRAARTTPSIQPPSPWGVLRAHMAAVTHSPSRYLRTLIQALKLSPGGVRAGLWHFFYFAEAIVLWDWLRERRIRHVHVHFANAATAIAMLYAHFGAADAASWSFTMHGPTEFDNVHSFRLAEKVIRARFVVCISDYARSQLMKLVEPVQWSKLEIVRCGIDPQLFRPSRPRHADAGQPPSGPDPHGRVTVLCVGRLVPEKGQSLLLEALDLLSSEAARKVRLVIAGDGPDRDKLHRLAESGASSEIVFTGAVNQTQLLSLYNDADIFCLPSLAEGLPVVLMEAMAMELPVVSTRIAGIPELVSDRQCGLLVTAGRVDQLAGALQELLEDKDLRRSLGRAGRERVMTHYDIRQSVARLHELYAAVVPV
jgi:colanic acid/amylovoran biosynthesis glycosyltransferase